MFFISEHAQSDQNNPTKQGKTQKKRKSRAKSMELEHRPKRIKLGGIYHYSVQCALFFKYSNN